MKFPTWSDLNRDNSDFKFISPFLKISNEQNLINKNNVRILKVCGICGTFFNFYSNKIVLEKSKKLFLRTVFLLD